jgi:hypothetical protein
MTSGLEQRVAALDWARLGGELDAQGFATTGTLLDPEACDALANGYDDDARFRSRIDMRRHGFGEGAYKYYAYPLPAPIERLRQAVYPRLVPIANRWMAALGKGHHYPATLTSFLKRCHEAGQKRPTGTRRRYPHRGHHPDPRRSPAYYPSRRPGNADAHGIGFGAGILAPPRCSG